MTPEWIQALIERETHSDTMKALSPLEREWLNDWRSHFDGQHARKECPHCGAYATRCNEDRDDGLTYCAMTGVKISTEATP